MYMVGTLSERCLQWGMGEERRISCTQWGTLTDTYPQMGMVRRRGSMAYMKWETLSDTCPQWGMWEEKRFSAMYTVKDAQSHISPGGEWQRGGSVPCT